MAPAGNVPVAGGVLRRIDALAPASAPPADGTRPEPEHPWLRHPDETAKAYAAFRYLSIDLHYLKNEATRAVRTLRAHRTPAGAAGPASTARVVPLTGQQIGQRFTAAASAAGLARRVTAHSGRVGLASELTARGASTTAVMLAGNWKTARMVAHYSAGATAERGAVATYL